MARPEIEAKTPLGARLRAIRKELGDPDRSEFAKELGVSKNTLASYERGETEPTATVMAAYREKFGISLLWIVLEQGAMFDDPSKAPAPSIKVDAWAMGRAYSVIEKVCKDIGRPVTGSQLAEEAAELYSALLGRVVDVRDRPMVEAALSVLAGEARERMIGAKPGIDKRSAS